MKTIYKITILLLLVSGAISQGFAQKMQLKVMCWNIKAFEGDPSNPDDIFKLEPFIEIIKKHNPDIIGFQELETHTSRQGSKELLTKLAAELGMYPQFGFSYIADQGSKGLYGNGLLSKYPILNSHSEPIPWEKDQADPRSFQWIDILIPFDGKEEMIRIVNTHLDHKSWVDKSFNYVREEACETSELPTILMGDFNFGINRYEYEHCLIPYFNLFDPGLWPDKLTGDYQGTWGGTKLDYIVGYPKGKWNPVDFKVDRSSGDLSDHYPVIVMLELNN